MNTQPDNRAVTHPFTAEWSAAAATVSRIISQVEQSLETMQSARSGLNWQGGSERYFQWQVARQYHYLGVQRENLERLRTLITRAAQAPVVTVHPQPLGASS